MIQAAASARRLAVIALVAGTTLGAAAAAEAGGGPSRADLKAALLQPADLPGWTDSGSGHAQPYDVCQKSWTVTWSSYADRLYSRSGYSRQVSEELWGYRNIKTSKKATRLHYDNVAGCHHSWTRNNYTMRVRLAAAPDFGRQTFAYRVKGVDHDTGAVNHCYSVSTRIRDVRMDAGYCERDVVPPKDRALTLIRQAFHKAKRHLG